MKETSILAKIWSDVQAQGQWQLEDEGDSEEPEDDDSSSEGNSWMGEG